MERYIRNYPSITEEEHNILLGKTVSVIGCGGLGGHIIDAIARIGVGCIKVIDCDEFSESNLNRQLLCTEKNIGKRKAKEASKRIKLINSNIKVKVIDKAMTADNAIQILKGSDILIDALDNIQSRLIAEEACNKLGIYFIHGAVAGWCGQASTVAPGSHFLEKIYPTDIKPKAPSVLSFVPDFVAGIQVAEAIKIMLSKDDTLEGKLLIADLRTMSINILEI